MVVVADPGVVPTIPRAFLEATRELKGEATFVTIPRPAYPSQEPADEAKALLENSLAQADVLILATSVSQSHIAAVTAIRKRGTRAASLPGITPEMMKHLWDPGLRERTARLAEILKGATSALLTTPQGTNLEFLLNPEKYHWSEENGDLSKAGAFENLPAGEISCHPLSAEGILVVDGCLTTPIGRVDVPFKIKIEKGMAREILGEGQTGNLLRQMLKEAADKLPPEKKHLAQNVAELGIGMNAIAERSGISLEEEKRCRPKGTDGLPGTLHVALGNDTMFGGEVNAGIHIDNIIELPTLTVFFPNGDKRKILENGILVV